MKITKSQLKQIIKEAIASTSLTKGMDFKMHPELAADIAAGKHNIPWQDVLTKKTKIIDDGAPPSLDEALAVINKTLTQKGVLLKTNRRGNLYLVTESGLVIGGRDSRPRLILAEDVGP